MAMKKAMKAMKAPPPMKAVKAPPPMKAVKKPAEKPPPMKAAPKSKAKAKVSAMKSAAKPKGKAKAKASSMKISVSRKSSFVSAVSNSSAASMKKKGKGRKRRNSGSSSSVKDEASDDDQPASPKSAKSSASVDSFHTAEEASPKGMKSMKKSAAASAMKKNASSNKRKKVLEQWEIERDEIKTVLINHYENEELRELFLDNVDSIFAKYNSERHAYQQQTAEMIGEVLTNLQANAKSKRSETQQLVANADKLKDDLNAHLERMDSAIANQNSTLEAKQLARNAQSDAVKSCETELEEKTDFFNQKNKDFEKAQKAYNDDDAKNAIFRDLQQTTQANEKAKKKKIKDVEVFCKKVQVEPSLLSGLPYALARDPETRGTFDNSVVNATAKAFQDHLSNCQEELNKKRLETDEAENARREAEGVHNETLQRLNQTDSEIETNESDLKELENQKKKILKEIKDLPKTITKNEKLHQENEDLVDLLENTLAQFVHLRDREAPPPEPSSASDKDDENDETEAAASGDADEDEMEPEEGIGGTTQMAAPQQHIRFSDSSAQPSAEEDDGY